MKEALVGPGPKVDIIDSPIPTPSPDEILIKVVVSGSNPVDWKGPEWNNKVYNSGDDIAGTVTSIGSNVTEFRKGDRVAAFHILFHPHGSYAEYAVAPVASTFHIPVSTSFEEAATVPLAAMTAAVGLFVKLNLPELSQVREQGGWTGGPLLIYGAATAVGAYAIKLAKKAGIGPLICVAGNGIPFVEGLIEKGKGDVIVDYRHGEEALVTGIKQAFSAPGARKLRYAFDTVSENGSVENIFQVLSTEGGKVVCVLPAVTDQKTVPKGVQWTWMTVASVHDKAKDWEFGYAWFRLFGLGLTEGWFTTHPYEVVPGGLNGLEKGLADLKGGKASAVKYVFRIAETEGAGQDSHI